MTIITQLSVQELKIKLDQQEPLLLLDVREPAEFAYAHIAGSVLIPLSQIPQHLHELNKEQEIVLICHHGFRSQQVALYLETMGFKHLANLRGGIDEWSLYCDTAVPRY